MATKGIPPTVNNFIAVLKSKLTQHDEKISRRERSPNIYRLGHFLEAAGKVEEDVLGAAKPGDTMTREVAEVMVRSLSRHFTHDFSPAKAVVKQLNEHLDAGKNPSLVR